MIINLNPSGQKAGASIQQGWDKSRSYVHFPVKIYDAEFFKLVTGGDLTNTEGIANIYRISQRPPSLVEGHFVGNLIYREAYSGDVEYPTNIPESYWVVVYMNDEVFEDSIRLCALGHIPSLTLNFPDDIDVNKGSLKRNEYGLSLDGHFRPGILWDNVKYPEVKIVSTTLNFPFTSIDNEEVEDEDEEDKAAAQQALPATRAQLEQLIKMVKYVGIGLGILAVVLHYVH